MLRQESARPRRCAAASPVAKCHGSQRSFSDLRDVSSSTASSVFIAQLRSAQFPFKQKHFLSLPPPRRVTSGQCARTFHLQQRTFLNRLHEHQSQAKWINWPGIRTDRRNTCNFLVSTLRSHTSPRGVHFFFVYRPSPFLLLSPDPLCSDGQRWQQRWCTAEFRRFVTRRPPSCTEADGGPRASPLTLIGRPGTSRIPG